MSRIILILAILIGFGCSDLEYQSPKKEERRYPDSILQKAQIILTNEGVKEAMIDADTLYVYDKEDSTVAINVSVDFFDENGVYRSTLTANEGLVRQKKQEFVVWGDVEVKSDTSLLQTESLRWDPESKLITTDDFVKIKRGSDIISGYGMEADNRLNNVRILRDVKGEISNMPQTESELDSLEGEANEDKIP